MTATLWRDELTGLIAVRFAYDRSIVDRLKTDIPRGNRKWDPERRLWLIDPPYEVTARRILGLNPKEHQRPHRQHQNIDTAIAAMFDALPEHLRKPTFKALIQVWHPDIDGDTDAAKALNAWRQRHAS